MWRFSMVFAYRKLKSLDKFNAFKSISKQTHQLNADAEFLICLWKMCSICVNGQRTKAATDWKFLLCLFFELWFLVICIVGRWSVVCNMVVIDYTRITIYFLLSIELKVDEKPYEIRLMVAFFHFSFMLILIHIFPGVLAANDFKPQPKYPHE